MLSTHDGGQVLSRSFAPNYLRSISPNPCEVPGEEPETHSDWLQAAHLGRVRGGIQTLICPPPLIPQWDWPEKILSIL